MSNVTVKTITGEQINGNLLDPFEEENESLLKELCFALGITDAIQFQDYIFIRQFDGMVTFLENNEIQSITKNLLLNYKPIK